MDIETRIHYKKLESGVFEDITTAVRFKKISVKGIILIVDGSEYLWHPSNVSENDDFNFAICDGREDEPAIEICIDEKLDK